MADEPTRNPSTPRSPGRASMPPPRRWSNRTRPPVRVRRPDRRAQCRQVDAGQCAGRRQGRDRHPQGADHARARARHRHRRCDAQLVLLDTPGIFAPKRRLDRAMVATAWSGAHDADIVCLLIDARRGIDDDAGAILDRLGEVERPLDPDPQQDRPGGAAEKLLALAQSLNARAPFTDTFMVSALTGDGVAELKALLAARVPQGPWHYPEDEISDAPLRSLAAEITREKLLAPPAPGTALRVDGRDRAVEGPKDGSVRIEQTIYVARESQRKIVLGKGGQTIKAIGADARREIADHRSRSRCTCSCSSRCAKAGVTIRSAIAAWGSSSRRNEARECPEKRVPNDGRDRLSRPRRCHSHVYSHPLRAAGGKCP